MLHNEARKLVLEAWDKTHNAKEIAKYFSVNQSTIYRLVEERARTGSYETRTQLRGRKPILTEKQNRSVPDVQAKRSAWIENISDANAEHQIYLDESGINTNLTRHYARAVHGKCAIDAAPINTPAGIHRFVVHSS